MKGLTPPTLPLVATPSNEGVSRDLSPVNQLVCPKPSGHDGATARTPVIALAGNPNAGKTSLFNSLTGQTQHVGNYPGVTVDKVSGRSSIDGREIEVVDLPGTYSLTAYSIEEIVTRDFVIKERPNVVVDVIDSTNLERNLYLLLQFQELGVPVVGALNMSDEAERQGLRIDVDLLSNLLGIPLVKTVGTRGTGKESLIRAVFDVLDERVSTVERHLNYGPELEERHDDIMRVLNTDAEFVQRYSLHWVAIKLLEEDADAVAKVRAEHKDADKVLAQVKRATQWIKTHFGSDSEVVVGEQRYAYIRGACRQAVQLEPQRKDRKQTTEWVDAIVLNRYLGVPVFFLTMLAIYGITFLIGTPLGDYVASFFAWTGTQINAVLPPGVLQDFIVNGVIAGVGSVLSFFPVVLFLFLGLSFLEDVGYMARAAFVMDKFLHIFGLHGRSFIPLMVSTGCAVPGVMSARTLVNPRDRTLTVLIAPLMMCGAKTPVIAMMSAAFFPGHAAIVFWSMWLFGWLLAFTVGFTFRKTLFRGEDSPFVMELPPYRLPTINGIASHMWQKGWSYLKKAWTFILAASIVIWALLSYPKTSQYSKDYNGQIASLQSAIQAAESSAPKTSQDASSTLDALRARVEGLKNEQRVEDASNSIAGRVGRSIDPVMRLAGFDWKLNVALFAGTAAKEVIISTLGIVYGLGNADADAEGTETTATPLKMRIKSDPANNPLAALAFMVFVMVYVPCIATLAVTKKELGSFKWVAVSAGYTLVLAYALAVFVYQIGKLVV